MGHRMMKDIRLTIAIVIHIVEPFHVTLKLKLSAEMYKRFSALMENHDHSCTSKPRRTSKRYCTP